MRQQTTAVVVNVIQDQSGSDVTTFSGSACERQLTYKDIPTHLRDKQYDVMLAYAPQSFDDVSKLKYILEEIVTLTTGESPSVYMYCCDSKSNYDLLQNALERVSAVFIYGSYSDFNDSYASHKKDEILSRCLMNPSIRLVPILPHRRAMAPNGMKSLKGLCMDKLLKGRSVSDVSRKDLDCCGASLLEVCEVTALQRLFDTGLLSKRQRAARQQTELKAWIRKKLRSNELRLLRNPTSVHAAVDQQRCAVVGAHSNSLVAVSDRSVAIERSNNDVAAGAWQPGSRSGCQEARENDENVAREARM